MWTAVPAAVFVITIILLHVTPAAFVMLTRRQPRKLFIEVRLFGLGFTFNIDNTPDAETKEITPASADSADQVQSNQNRDDQRSELQ